MYSDLNSSIRNVHQFSWTNENTPNSNGFFYLIKHSHSCVSSFVCAFVHSFVNWLVSVTLMLVEQLIQ